MKAYQHKPNSGNLFKNDEMICETDPYFKGTVLVGGVEYFCSCFDGVTANDKPIRRLKFLPMSDIKKRGMEKAKAALEQPKDDFEDELPEFK